MERKGQDIASSMKERCFCWNVFALQASRVPLPPGSLFPSRTSLWIQSGGRTLTPLELNPGDGGFKTTGFRGFFSC